MCTTDLAFIDIEKAFDNINWEILFTVMQKIGMDFKDRRCVHNLYKNQNR